MGLFNFLKPQKKRELDAILQKIQAQIFPNGKNQINAETRQVRELLDFKYTLEETKSTYIHAAAIYFIAKDKSQERIVTSILHNDKSVITKNDAIRLYSFLVEKFNSGDLRDQLVNEINQVNDSQKLFYIAIGGIVPLKKYKDLSNEGKFEVLLFNSVAVLSFYQNEYPNKYEKTRAEYFQKLIEQANQYELNFITDDRLIWFTGTRLKFYSEELNKVYSQKQYTPMALYSIFYETPLELEPSVSNDIIEVLTFYEPLIEMLNWISDKCQILE